MSRDGSGRSGDRDNGLILQYPPSPKGFGGLSFFVGCIEENKKTADMELSVQEDTHGIVG